MSVKQFHLRVLGTTILASWSWDSVGSGIVFEQGAVGDTYILDDTIYSTKIGPKGPKQVLFGVWNQAPVGYCHETGNLSENLYAKWASRGINTIKAGHPDFPIEGQQEALLAATKLNNLMLIAAPRWNTTMFGDRGADLAPYDLRSLAINDPYWRVNWISYSVQDEPDLFVLPLSDHVTFLTGHALGGLTKSGCCNFTRRFAVPAGSDASPTINYHDAFNVPAIKGLFLDSYEWHLDNTDANSATVTKSSPQMMTSTWHGDGIYETTLPATTTMLGRRFTATITGMATHLQRFGPMSPGRSDSGVLPVQYPPVAFNTPPFTTYGQIIPPVANTYGPNDKWLGHYVSTSRVEIYPSNYGRAGQWQPGRFLRNEAWSGFTHGSSACYIFPQTVGTRTVTGYIDAVANTLVVTAEPPKPFLFGGGLGLRFGDFTRRGFIRKTSPQLSGTPGGAGTYALDTAYGATIATGSVGSPVTIEVYTMSGPAGDDSNEQNLTELATIIANVNRMQAHPTGGNLLIDTVNGGRRAYEVMRCPDINGDVSLYREDMTLAPIQPGYTSGGVAVLDDAGQGPLWDFGWPMGFEGFRVVGDDGATYIYVRSLSNSDRPTWFPGYAALGLEARVFRAFELVGLRRVGTGAAVEMTGTSAVLRAGVDDGPATWFYIETAAISQNEGNTGNTAYNIIVRRGGDLSGTNTVTASVSGTGFAPANAADFGGSFPSQVLTFNPTETTKTFTVNVSGDTTAELDETFRVALSAPSTGCALVGSNKSEITCTILNDDAALVGAFVWLVNTDETSALALPGSPAGATFLKPAETTYVTRAGIRMKSIASGTTATNNGGFASVPWWQQGSVFNGADFELDAGTWEVGFILSGRATGATIRMIDDPAGAATLRQTLAADGALVSLSDTDGTTYTNATTAVAEAVNNLTYVTATVTDLGGGKGVLRIHGNTNALLAAVSLRQV